MHTKPRPRYKPSRARIASFARLWLACVATLLTCAAHLLPPALQRRLPLLDLPTKTLAKIVARLIFICAVEEAAPPKRSQLRALRDAGALRALLRAGAQRHLVNAHGDFDLTQIARTCANPDAAIADTVAALARGLTRRRPILPRAACEALPALTLTPTHACDTS